MTTTLRTTTTNRTAATKRAPMDKTRKTALTGLGAVAPSQPQPART